MPEIYIFLYCSGFGDAVCTTPTLRKIYKAYNKSLNLFVKDEQSIDVFKNIPYINEVSLIEEYDSHEDEFRKNHPDDEIYSFYRYAHQGTQFAKQNMMDIRQFSAHDMGWDHLPEDMNCDYVANDYETIIGLPTQYIVIHPAYNGGSWDVSRTWKKQNWQELADYYASIGLSVVAVGKTLNQEQGPMEIDIKLGLNLINKTNLSQLWHILDRAEYIVTNDSGILHMAGTTDSNIIYLAGSVQPKFRAPYRNGSQDYKLKILMGECDLFCASNLEYAMREHGDIDSVPPLWLCMENFDIPTCMPTVNSVIKEIGDFEVKQQNKIDNRDNLMKKMLANKYEDMMGD